MISSLHYLQVYYFTNTTESVSRTNQLSDGSSQCVTISSLPAGSTLHYM